jgi:hypothetical protein
VVILDDLKAKSPSRFQWLLQAYEQAKQTGANSFEIVRDGVRLSVQRVMPQRSEANIGKRELDGSATNGTITTLDLSVSSAERATFLMVLTALPDPGAPIPDVKFSNGKLTVAHAGKSWNITVKDADDAKDPATPLLMVQK